VAIKGKKKSRGSQARRRPAAAPRPVIIGGRRAPWYKTPGGRIGLALGIVAVAAISLFLWNNAQNNAEALEGRQKLLDGYTGKVRTMLQTLTPPASQMQVVPPTGKGKAIAKLDKDAKTWTASLQKATNQAISLTPPPAGQTSAQLIAESVQLYLTAARTFQTAAALEDGPEKKQVLQRAAEVRDRATSIWTAGVALLDEARSGAELEPSGLRVPTSPTG
jgi:hypothetical protein